MYAKLAVAVVAALIGSGCIRSATLITVKPDGSGTIDQMVLMNAAALKGMLGGLGGAQQPAPGAINEDEFRKTAARLGEGVTYVSSEPIKEADGFEGGQGPLRLHRHQQAAREPGPEPVGIDRRDRQRAEERQPGHLRDDAQRRCLEPHGDLQRQA